MGLQLPGQKDAHHAVANPLLQGGSDRLMRSRQDSDGTTVFHRHSKVRVAVLVGDLEEVGRLVGPLKFDSVRTCRPSADVVTCHSLASRLADQARTGTAHY